MAEYEDPIVEEVHETRARLLEKYGGSAGYAEHLKRLEADMKERVVTREPRRPKTTEKNLS